MKKQLISFLPAIMIHALAFSQTSTKLKFEQGKSFVITMDTKTQISQQAMGQAIDFTVNATGIHTYKVTNATEDNTTLHHEVKKITFAFDGMGQKMSFDSDKEKDMNGPFGKPVKEMKEKPYDMVIDPVGTVMMAFPEKINTAQTDSRMAIINSMMKEVMDMVQPPPKGGGSFFKVLPDKEMTKGDTWNDAYENESGKFATTYTVADINDSTYVLDFTGNSSTVTKFEMMGNTSTTTMNHKSTGKVILDKATRLIKEKTITMEGSGNNESSFGTLPVTSRVTINIAVKPGE